MDDYKIAAADFAAEVKTEAARLIMLGVPPWDALIQARRRVSEKRRVAARVSPPEAPQ